MIFEGLRNDYGAILADPPWGFKTWSSANDRGADHHYGVMRTADICALPVRDLPTNDAVLFIWCCWPQLTDAFRVIKAWGFEYKTCGFLWAKAHANQLEMFQDHIDAYMGLGYWTRANSEPCLLATRGNPKRLNADVKQTIIEPRREHSRKPDCVHERIERLVAGPYLELFARQRRPNWDCWGDQVDKFKEAAE